jgi:hypothetical protein
MNLLIALACSAVLIAIMGICAFAGKPTKDALDEIQSEDAK